MLLRYDKLQLSSHQLSEAVTYVPSHNRVWYLSEKVVNSVVFLCRHRIVRVEFTVLF